MKHVQKQSTTVQRRFEYLPPNEENFDQLAREVCSRLAASNAQSPSEPETVDGLAHFLKTVAALTAKSLSNGCFPHPKFNQARPIKGVV